MTGGSGVAFEDVRTPPNPAQQVFTKTGRFAAVLLWFVIVAALLVRIHAVTNVKEGLTHDESIAWL